MTPPYALRQLIHLLYLGSVIPLLLLFTGLVAYEYRTFLIREHTYTMQELVQALVLPRTAEAALPMPLRELALLLVDHVTGTDFSVIVLDAQARPIAASSDAAQWQDLAQQSAQTNAPAIQTLSNEYGEWVVYHVPVTDPQGQRLGTIITSFATAVVQPELHALYRWLILTVLSVLLLALLVAPLVARLATRPLAGVVHTAQQVAAGDLSQRAPPSTIRELQTLATALNTMLSHVEATVHHEQQVAQTLRRFVGDAAHELRSPLAVLRSSLTVGQMAQARGDLPEAERATALLHSEIERMSRLVDDLLLLARMDTPREAELVWGEVEPVPLLEEVAERARLLATGQIIVTDWAAAPSEPLRGDEELLRRALNNLIENALRHTPAGATITLRVAAEPQGCAFTVADQGCGIAPEHLPHLFSRFYQVDHARTRPHGGSGLGLAIVQRIVQAHGGTVHLSSEVGQGTQVVLRVPSQTPALASTAPPPAAPTTIRLARPPARPQSHWGQATGWMLAGGLITVGVLFSFNWLTETSQPLPTVAPVVVQRDAVAAPAPMQPPAPQRELGPLRFDAAIALAQHVQGGGTAIKVSRKNGLLSRYEITLSDYTRILVEFDAMGQGQVVQVRPDKRGHGRGVQRQRLEAAQIAGWVAQGGVALSFDMAAAAAQQHMLDAALFPDEVALKWHPAKGRLVYVVEWDAWGEVIVDPQTGAVLAWDD